MHNKRFELYKKLEEARKSRVIAYITGDRESWNTQIAYDALPLFTEHLDAMGVVKKISLFLYTRGGMTMAAWAIINLIRSFCDELEIIIPFHCHSAGTLMCLGANCIVMTKQATLGPIDPSLTGPMNPIIPGVPFPNNRYAVSVEHVNAYLDIAKKDLKIKNQDSLAKILIDLSNKIHPLTLGAVYKSTNQIKMLAEKLLKHSDLDADKKKKLISFLCSESGSHDYAINRREAKDNLGLNIEKPTENLYTLIKDIYKNIEDSLLLKHSYNAQTYYEENKKNTNGQLTAVYRFERGLVESLAGGSDIYISEGTLSLIQTPQGPMLNDFRKKEGWEHV